MLHNCILLPQLQLDKLIPLSIKAGKSKEKSKRSICFHIHFF
jgi:hypothetical protein